MPELSISRVDQLLAEISSRQPKARGNLIFGLDATASRERTWDTQAQMFLEVATIGTLDLQLVYFRGNGECRASGWVNDPLILTRAMVKIRCEAGCTQIGRVLVHAAREATRRSVNAVVFVGDACEEGREVLVQSARELGGLGVPVFMFQEGHDPIARARFREIAELTRGAYHRFDQGSARQLGELLRAVAAFAVGGIAALEQQDSAAARLLLGQMG